MTTRKAIVWNADEPKICGTSPVRIVLGRLGDNISFIEAHQYRESISGKRMMSHYVEYKLNEAEILRMYEALKAYVERKEVQ